jgi:hypothetical protein
MNRRIKTELAQLNLEVNSTGSYIFNNNDGVELKFYLPKNYPFNPPQINILKPYETVCPDVHWSPSTKLQDFIDETIQKIMTEGIEIEQHIPVITDPAYLVLGSSYEEERNRDHYDNPTIFLLDRGNADINISFSNPTQLGILSSLLSNKFDEICFDWSTLKFFSNDDMLIERLTYLKRMLKPGGKIYFETIHGSPGGGKNPLDTTNYHDKFIEYCNRAGFEIEGVKTNEEIGNTSVLVPILFIGDERASKILIAHKPFLGGKTRKKKHKKTKRRRVLFK